MRTTRPGRMGTFNVGCLIKNAVDREKAVRIPKLMVDTGSEATWIPKRMLVQAAIKPEKRQAYQMANGQWLYRDVGYAVIRVGDLETIEEVVFAEPGDYSLLGAHTLEGLNLVVDSRSKRLIPGPVRQAQIAPRRMGDPGFVMPAREVQGKPGPAPVVAFPRRRKATKRNGNGSRH